MKTISGRYFGDIPALGRITYQRLPFAARGKAILVTDSPKWSDFGYTAIITTNTTSAPGLFTSERFIVESVDSFQAGDVVLLTDEHAHLLWEAAGPNNGLLLTEACNCRCLMCPQPPKSFDEKTFHLAQKILTLSPSGFKGEICLTGGEPTLCGSKMLDILAACKIRHPEACIIILTNGKRFRDFSFAKRFAQFGTQTTVAVSLHADTDTLHDRIVGVSGSFHKTQQGIYNLAKLGQRIEIRIVVNRINHVRLLQIAKHIYRNYPFAAHVTFMALEVTGNAVGNFESIWVDPIEYSQHLEIALHELHRNGMYVSAYNHPLCLLPKQAWPYARKSISSWKEAYLPVCDHCRIRENCCGVFSTSNDRLSKNIHPIVD